MKIRTKAESVRLFEEGFFGNPTLTWETPRDYYDSKYEGAVVLRYRGTGGGGPCVYNLKGFYEVYQAVRFHVEQGHDEHKIWLNAQMPDKAIVIQGEYWVAQSNNLSPDIFYYSEAKLHMRDALRHSGGYASQLAADELLRRRLPPKDWANFKQLRDLFPGHVIEISVYSEPVGKNNWNSVVWEVRSY